MHASHVNVNVTYQSLDLIGYPNCFLVYFKFEDNQNLKKTRPQITRATEILLKQQLFYNRRRYLLFIKTVYIFGTSPKRPSCWTYCRSPDNNFHPKHGKLRPESCWSYNILPGCLIFVYIWLLWGKLGSL